MLLITCCYFCTPIVYWCRILNGDMGISGTSYVSKNFFSFSARDCNLAVTTQMSLKCLLWWWLNGCACRCASPGLWWAKLAWPQESNARIAVQAWHQPFTPLPRSPPRTPSNCSQTTAKYSTPKPSVLFQPRIILRNEKRGNVANEWASVCFVVVGCRYTHSMAISWCWVRSTTTSLRFRNGMN